MNQPVGAHRDQEHRRDIAEPGDQEERPYRQAQVEGEHVVGARPRYLVEQRVSLHRHYEQQHKRREDVDGTCSRGPTLA